MSGSKNVPDLSHLVSWGIPFSWYITFSL